jgi:hypothetical protein
MLRTSRPRREEKYQPVRSITFSGAAPLRLNHLHRAVPAVPGAARLVPDRVQMKQTHRLGVLPVSPRGVNLNL